MNNIYAIFQSFLDNASTILIAFVIFALVAFVSFKLIRDKIQGRRKCSCGCEDCPSKNNCK